MNNNNNNIDFKVSQISSITAISGLKNVLMGM